MHSKNPGRPAHGQFGTSLQATLLDVEQKFLPALRALAIAVHHANDVLVTPLVGPDDDQDALFVMLHAGREIDPIGPEVNVAFGQRIALPPGFILVPPERLQPGNGAGRQTRRARITVTRPARLDPDRAAPGLYLPFRQIAVPDNTGSTLGIGQIRMTHDRSLDFCLNRLTRQPPGTGPQDIRQRIIGK